MNGIQALGSEPGVARFGWTLLHFLWQGTAIAALYMLVRFLFGRTLPSRTRYALGCAALIAMVLAPLLTYFVLTYFTISNAAIPQAASWTTFQAEWNWLPAAFAGFWALGVLGFSIRLFGAFRFTRRLRTTSCAAPDEWQQTLQEIAARMGRPFFAAGRSARLMVSSLVNVPAIIGYARPMILVPAAALTGLPPEHIRALLAHELAHVRRNDYIASVLQSLAEVVLFYHPAVWWISGQIRTERELCCDDLVIGSGTDVLTYARALTELESRRPGRLTPQLAANSGSLGERIRRLLDPAHIGARCVPRAGNAWAMILLWLVGAGVSGVHGAQTSITAPRAMAAAIPAPAKLPDSVSALASSARNTLLFDPVLTAQLAQPQPRPAAVPAPPVVGARVADPVAADAPGSELTIAAQVDFFRINNAESFVPVSLVISGGDLAQARKSGTSSMEITGEITDSFGTLVQHLQDHIDIVLAGATSSATSPELASRPIEYQAGFTLLPGKYSLKIVARDSTTGVVATFENAFMIPNLNKEEQRIPISSVVLGSLRAGPATRPAANPLYQEGQLLVPNVTRVFSSRSDMAVYLQAFEKGASATQPLVASVSFLRESVKVMETPQVTVTDGLDPKSRMVPIRMNVPLSQLKPGNYLCQVTVLDPATQKTASWEAPVAVTP